MNLVIMIDPVPFYGFPRCPNSTGLKVKQYPGFFAKIIAGSPQCYKLAKHFKSIIKIYKLTLLEL